MTPPTTPTTIAAAPRSHPWPRASAIYVGTLRHRRLRPKPHQLRVPLFMMYLDLDELPRAFDGRWLWSLERFNVASFHRADYLAGPPSLKEAVLVRVQAALGFRPAGPVRMLTHLRYLGYVFNPVTFYYCFDPTGTHLEAILAEITNTPWKERHAYVLDARSRPGVVAAEFPKAFHVSPFMPMDQRYRWHFRPPGERLIVHMENLDARGRLFDATLSLHRRPLDGPSLANGLLRFPLMPLRVVASIHWHAARLWLKGVPFHPHPSPGSGPRPPDGIQNRPSGEGVGEP